jgi:hypothetical protein
MANSLTSPDAANAWRDRQRGSWPGRFSTYRNHSRLNMLLRSGLAILGFVPCLSGCAKAPVVAAAEVTTAQHDETTLKLLLSSFAVCLTCRKSVDATLKICLSGASQEGRKVGGAVCSGLYSGILESEIESLEGVLKSSASNEATTATKALIDVHRECQEYAKMIGTSIKMPEASGRGFLQENLNDALERFSLKRAAFVDAVKGGWELDATTDFRLTFLNM